MPSFLQTTFLAGLAALAVPVLIHLFFRLKTKRVELGTIRFLRVVLEENARRRKVMRWFLLMLRMAFVALLVGLFARPFLTAAATSGQNDLLVILIDQSATMQLKGDHGRLIDQAVAEAKKLIESAGRDTRFEVAFFDHSVRPLMAAKEGDGATGEAVLSRLQAPATTFGATNFGAAFAWARDICVKAPPGVKQMHLFTDLQRSGLDWTDVEPLPAEVRSHLHDLGQPVVNNLAVTEVRTPRLWVRPGETPIVRASIMHGGAFALEEVSIVLEAGRVEQQSGRGQSGRTAERQRSEQQTSEALTTAALSPARLAERVTKRERVKLEPGATVTLDFELPALSEGLWQGRVMIDYDDDLPFDNQRHFAISATPAYRVLVVNGGASGPSIHSETYFLEAALRLAAEQESFADSPFAPTVIASADAAGLPNLAEFAAVVLANVANVSRTDAEKLASFVRGGGGLLVFTGENMTAKTCASLSDAGLAAGEIGELNIAHDLPWRLSKWEETHPIFEPLSDPQHGDLRRSIFAAYTRTTPLKDASVLAEFNTGDAAMLERALGKGAVIWVTTSCGRDWSDWCRSRMFLPTVHQLLGYQVGLTAGGRVRTRLVDAGQKSEARATDVRAAEQRSDGGQTPPTSVVPASAALTSVALTSVPGVVPCDGFVEVVNTSPRESETDRCTRQEFEDRFVVKFVDDEGSNDTQAASMGNVEFRQDELWHWIACGLLGVMLLEGFVGNRTTA